MDILSNRALSHLWGISGRHVYEYPARDASTERLLSSGDVFGILYCESPAMRKALRVLQPASRRGTLFTCCASSKVQMLTPQALRRAGARARARARLLVQKYLLFWCKSTNTGTWRCAELALPQARIRPAAKSHSSRSPVTLSKLCH